jgi:NAD(P)-dependent dehydrogenase (short-subunit alcohol dehydrogenase family)
MPGKTLVVIGSKTKLGLAVARAFCVRGFTHIALLSDDIEQLRSDKDQVLDAIQERGYSCQVRTWTCQVDDVTDLDRTLAETETYGELECIFVDAVPAVDPDPAAEGFGVRLRRGSCLRGLVRC